MTLVCLDCDADLEHCHGTALLFSDGSYDCSDDPDCRHAVALHLFVSLEEDEADRPSGR